MSESFGNMFERHLRKNPELYKKLEQGKQITIPEGDGVGGNIENIIHIIQTIQALVEELEKIEKIEKKVTRAIIQRAVANGGKLLEKKQTDFLIRKKPAPYSTEKKYPIIVSPVDQHTKIYTSEEFNVAYIQYRQLIGKARDHVDSLLGAIKKGEDVSSMEDLTFTYARDVIDAIDTNTTSTPEILPHPDDAINTMKITDMHILYEFLSTYYAKYKDSRKGFITHIWRFLESPSSLTHDEKMKMLTYVIQNH